MSVWLYTPFPACRAAATHSRARFSFGDFCTSLSTSSGFGIASWIDPVCPNAKCTNGSTFGQMKYGITWAASSNRSL
ncbi:MAG: hypothetical protein E6G64_09330 [Actinobacteria bacterium]|nr:MAG: hypothetical protein E6G64_09330 [Actinomycetota bacterium]